MPFKHTAHKLLTLLLISLFALSVMAKGKDKVNFYARIICNSTQIVAGDSTLVSVILYADAPFSTISGKPKQLKVKNGRIRSLNSSRQRHTANQFMENGKLWYSMVWEQYVVGSDRPGKITISPKSFSGTFIIYEETPNPVRSFFGYQPKYHEAKAHCKGGKTTISVIANPKRSTKEMMNKSRMVAMRTNDKLL